MKVLVFDRDTGFRQALEQILDQAGYQVLGTDRSDELLRLLREGSYEVVVLDLGAGGLSQLPLLAAAAEASPRSRFVLAATDHGRLPLEEVRKHWDVMGLLGKPLRRTDLLRLVRRAAEAA